uniref:Uncharacterized protein n=1 Tax=Moschus moschiferus TaxID=68415 RepID=A0A8C6DSW7_MOSMO
RWRGQQKDLKCQWREKEAERDIFPAREDSEQAQDMLQGSYPKTLEEQVATAKKYNIQVEDEEPWLDDGIMGYGNYLKFPDSSQQERDPWCDWDHPDLMLNWGEPRPHSGD